MPKIILCIDDDDDDLDLFDEAIAEINLSYTCVKAHDGKEGLAILKFIIPEYIFLDINMPRMTGIDVLRLIRTQRSLDKVPVIIFSTTIPDEEKLKKEGANACLKKPATFIALCNSLRTFLLPDSL